MRLLTFTLSIIFVSLLALPADAQQNRKKLVRVKQNADGTITELEEKDRRTIVRRTLREKANKERIVSSKSTYLMDRDRVLRKCEIADGQGKLLFVVHYGYDRDTGRLIAEAMFDARVKHFNDKGQIMPVQRLYYKYDAHGNRSKPFAITSVGKDKIETFTNWNNHIQERLKNIEANFGEGPTLSDVERQLQKDNERNNR